MAKSPYQLWKEQQEREAKGQSTVPKAPYRAVQYSNPTYKGKSEEKSYKWETENLRSMKSSKNVRSYNDKFSNWAKNNGLSSSEAKDFRTWLDSREDGVKTNTDFMSETLNSLRKRNQADAERVKNAPRKKEQPKKETKSKNSFFKDIGAGFKSAGQAANPFDDVSMSEALMNFANRNKSKGFQELQRGSNRAVDSASLGALSAIDRKMTGDTPYYMTPRKVGEGGGTDMLTSGLGYLVPGAGAYKALGATKAGKGLEALAQQGLKQRIGAEAAKGTITGAGVAGAEIGIREGLTPEQYSASDNLKHLGLGTAAGAIADPLLYGAGQGVLRGLSKFAKGDVPAFTGKPSEQTLNKLKAIEAPKNPTEPNFDSLLNLKKAETPSLTKIKRESLQPGRDFEPIEMMKDNGGSLKMGTPIDRTPIDINNPKEIVKRQIDTSGKREKSKWSFDKAYTAIMDDLHPLNKATKELGGKDLSFDKNPYTQARLARGVAGKAETYLKGGIYTEDGKKVGSSLQEIIKPIEKKMDDFLAYVTSKRALDYDEKGLIAGIKPKDVEGMSDRQLADATIRQIEAESPEMKTVHEQLVSYNNKLMDELVDAGVLSKESVESIRSENPNYIPMFRVQDPKVRGFQPLTNPKRTFANLGEPLKKRTGSEKEIINPIESIIKNTYLMLNMAERNKVGRSLLELVEESGENGWGRVVKVDNGLSVDEISKSLDDTGMTMTEGKTDAVDNLFKGKGNKVYVYRDGQKVEMELQEDLYKSMLSLDAQKQNWLINLMSTPTSWLRQGAVLSPDFGPVNIIRDQFAAFVNSKYGYIPFVDMAKGLTNVLKKDDMYWLWKNSGGANSILANLDREYLQEDLRSMVKQSLSSKLKYAAKSPVKTGLSPLRKMSEITEEATRLGEFKKGIKKGATPKEAAFASRDLIDFYRGGSVGRHINQVVAFFNPAIQSMDKTVRVFKENPLGASARAVTSITLPSIALYMHNHDQEWYQEIPQRERDLYWHFKAGEHIYKVPKPFELGVIFGTFPERILASLMTNDPDAFKELAETTKQTFTPPWIPTALAPWAEVYANKSMYFDSPIVPRREEGLLPEDQYGPYQSEVSKAFGKITKTSPRKAEHVFKGYTGGLGKYALQISDSFAKMAGVNKPELPDRGLVDLPIVNRFVVKNLEGNNQSVNDFYDRIDKLRRENLSAKKYNPGHENTGTYKAINKLSREISELQAAKRAVIEDPNMSGKEKAEVIKKIDTQITAIARAGNNLP